MTEPDVNTDPLRAAAEGKRPWKTPRIIESQIASRTGVANPTSTPFVDLHRSSGTVMDGS
jgi:hypothetical protein